MVVLLVDQEEPLEPVLEYQERYQLTSPILMDPSGSIGRLYGLFSTPTTFFLDSDGVILDIVVGILQFNWLESNLKLSIQ